MLSEIELTNLQIFRRTLHRYPELSGKEERTAARIVEFLENLNTPEIYSSIGGHGVLARFTGSNDGPSILVRADMDALPITEKNSIDYRSVNTGVAHLCGHDGHTTIVLGLATVLSKKPPASGHVSILFQPAEETGQGARRVLNDPVFQSFHYDQVIALHNLPGYEMNQVVAKDGPFASASQGLVIYYEGRTSHAAEPERGINPVDALNELIKRITSFRKVEESSPFQLATIVHLIVGEESFGISPGTGKLCLTLRAETDQLLREMRENILGEARELSERHGLTWSYEEKEQFSATLNDQGFADDIAKCASELNCSFHELDQAFRWSEDIGILIGKYGGGMLGLGAGLKSPVLHNPSYDFPDQITKTGIELFYKYINLQLRKHASNLLH